MRSQPSGSQGGGGLARQVVIALHHLRPSGQDLSRPGLDAKLGPGHRRSDRPQPLSPEAIHGQQGRRLGHAVALDHRDAGRRKEFTDLDGERRAPAADVPQPSAGGGAQAAQDDQICERQAQP